MPDPVKLAKAELWELDAHFKPAPDGTRVRVQFNPETLKVSFTNNMKQPEGNKAGTASLQFVGTATTKLSLQLWFDVNAPQPEQPPGGPQGKVTDVRRLTQSVARFMKPSGRGRDPKAPRAVRFIWGTFVFDGVMESLEESLELFSPDGRPLRASVTVSLSQAFQAFAPDEDEKKDRQKPPKQLTSAPAGATLQGLASSAGKGDDWQDIAAANGIENPRALDEGQIIDLNPRKPPRKPLR